MRLTVALLLLVAPCLAGRCGSPVPALSTNPDSSINITVTSVTDNAEPIVTACNTSFACADFGATGGMSLLSTSLSVLGSGSARAQFRIFHDDFVDDFFTAQIQTNQLAGAVTQAPSPSPFLFTDDPNFVVTILTNASLLGTEISTTNTSATVLLRCEGGPMDVTGTPTTPAPCVNSRQALTVHAFGEKEPAVISQSPPGRSESSTPTAPLNVTVFYAHTKVSDAAEPRTDMANWTTVANATLNTVNFMDNMSAVSVASGGAENCSVEAAQRDSERIFFLRARVVDWQSGLPQTRSPICVFSITLQPQASAMVLCGDTLPPSAIFSVLLSVAPASHFSGAEQKASSTPPALKDFATATTIVSGLSGNSNAAAKASTIGTLRRLMVCQEINEPINSLTGLRIGASDFDYLRGAVVGNLGLAVGAFAGIFLMCAVIAGLSSFPWWTSVTVMAELLHLRSMAYPVMVAVLQPTVGSSMTLLVNSTDMGDRLLGSIGLVVCLVYPVYVGLVLRQSVGSDGAWCLHLVPRVLDQSAKKFAVDHPGMYRFFFSPQHFVATSASGKTGAVYKRQFLFFFREYRLRYFSFVNDMLTAVLLGLVAGTAVVERSVCEFQIACIFSVSFAQFLAACVAAPCLTLFDALYLNSANGISLLIGTVMFANALSDQDSPLLGSLERALSVALGIPGAIKAVVELVWFLVALPGIYRKTRLLFARRAAASGDTAGKDSTQMVVVSTAPPPPPPLPLPTVVGPPAPAAAVQPLVASHTVPLAVAGSSPPPPSPKPRTSPELASDASTPRNAGRSRSASTALQCAPTAPQIGSRTSLDDLMDALLADGGVAVDEIEEAVPPPAAAASNVTPPLAAAAAPPNASMTYFSLGETEFAVDSILIQTKIRSDYTLRHDVDDDDDDEIEEQFEL